MKLTLVRHEISGRLAYRNAIQHQAKVLWPNVFAAHFQALGHCRSEANRVAAQAFLDTFPHFTGELVHGRLLRTAEMP
jgi:hypothetical protein